MPLDTARQGTPTALELRSLRRGPQPGERT